MKKIVGIVLAGGRVDELSVLTHSRAKAALSFGGKYHIIDFVLSNLMYADVSHVAILAQYRPRQLMDQIGTGEPWDFVGRRRKLSVRSPYQGLNDHDWYRGTADAIYQNLDFIEGLDADLVLVLSGDHIYRMDYRPLIDFHCKKGAKLTMGLKPVPREGASRFGIAELNGEGRVVSYEEKPANPRTNLASLTIWLFDRAALVRALKKNTEVAVSHQVYDEIIPPMVKEEGVYGYIHEGYWEYARTIADYYQANMELLKTPPSIDLEAWQIRSNMAVGLTGDLPPTRFCSGARMENSLISVGGEIAGAVEGSVLSSNVTVGEGARVFNSIIMRGVRIEAGAQVERAILDTGAVVGAGSLVGRGKADVPNRKHPELLNCGITVIGEGTTLPARTVIGTNCIIHPGLGPSAIPPRVQTGETIKCAS